MEILESIKPRGFVGLMCPEDALGWIENGPIRGMRPGAVACIRNEGISTGLCGPLLDLEPTILEDIVASTDFVVLVDEG